MKKQLRDTTDSREMIEKLGTPPLQNVDEIKEIMMAAEKGDCLTPYQLERVERVLVAVRRLKDYLGRGKMYDNPIAFYEENLDEAGDVREEICRQIRMVRWTTTPPKNWRSCGDRSSGVKSR